MFFFKIIFLIGLATCFFSCQFSSSNDHARFQKLDSTLQQANKTISRSTITILNALRKKATDPPTKTKAEVWLPKAEKGAAITKPVYDTLVSLISELLKQGDYTNKGLAGKMFIDNSTGQRLFDQLKTYRQNLLEIDPLIASEFTNSLPLKLTPLTSSKSQSWVDSYFSDATVGEALASLREIQSQIKVSENTIIGFCNEQVSDSWDGFYTYTPLISLNSSHLFEGETLEIMAAIGSFSKKAEPFININGKTIDLEADGAAHYKLKVTKTGTYSIPLKFTFKDYDGQARSEEKIIKYTVTKPY